jgi:hypothetical protein
LTYLFNCKYSLQNFKSIIFSNYLNISKNYQMYKLYIYYHYSKLWKCYEQHFYIIHKLILRNWLNLQFYFIKYIFRLFFIFLTIYFSDAIELIIFCRKILPFYLNPISSKILITTLIWFFINSLQFSPFFINFQC